jgi:multiple sugar transport system permease protein
MMPLFLMLKWMGLVNSYAGVVDARRWRAMFGIFLVRQYARSSMPDELLEAARIDGASELAASSCRSCCRCSRRSS